MSEGVAVDGPAPAPGPAGRGGWWLAWVVVPAVLAAAVLARALAEETKAPAWALRRYESIRIGRTTRLQQVSHARAHVNHLPDGPEQEARDRSLAAADPLAASAWIYAYDPDTAEADAAV